jgi:hypothetical protein
MIHSPNLIFNFKPVLSFTNYTITEECVKKLLNTIKYIKNNEYKKIESLYADEEQNIEVHSWGNKTSCIEYRNFECENSTDIVEVGVFEDTDNTYNNLLIFEGQSIEGIYNRFVIGNDFFNNGFVYTEEFEWNLYDGYNNIDIDFEYNIDIDNMDNMSLNNTRNYNLKNIIKGFEEFIV